MDRLISDLNLRFVFVGGKGGVGKTTSSASVATCFAQRLECNRVLLISTDPAHSLGDAFKQKFEPGVPTRVFNGSSSSSTSEISELSGDHSNSCLTGNLNNFCLTGSLDVLEVDPQSSLEEEIGEWTRLMEEGGVPEAAATMNEFQEWLRQIPGIDEATAISNVEPGYNFS